MLKPRTAQLAALILACGVVLLASAPTSAQTKFLEHIRRKYQMNPSNGKCALCHLQKEKEEPSRKNLNELGTAIQSDPDMKPLLGKDDKYAFKKEELAVVEKIVAKFDYTDTDKDGAYNREEYELGTFPADAKSVPEKRALEKFRKANPVPKDAAPAGGAKK